MEFEISDQETLPSGQKRSAFSQLDRKARLRQMRREVLPSRSAGLERSEELPRQAH